ncbi:MAG: hypothetical protein CVU54_03290 [Deltaproteobacteria bacterium HGW-Deltaproteobacteria-12]|jgi:iron-sulfur cluster repair protein YtfE (RIC family)|nr:MAG: hypothetical protein CVU54_03290 [Deltaproteobacteria bacterium HGW-Deltaproteobacteria-12]
MVGTTTAGIAADATLLDVVSKWPTTEMVFRRYDDKAGTCLCCTCLFDTIEDVAVRHTLDLAQLMRELEDVVAGRK